MADQRVSTRALEAATTTAKLARFELEVIEAPDATKKRTYENTAAGVGTDPTDDFVLTAGPVSLFQFKIHHQRRRCILTDLNSTNGTYINDSQVVEAYPTINANVDVGET